MRVFQLTHWCFAAKHYSEPLTSDFKGQNHISEPNILQLTADVAAIYNHVTLVNQIEAPRGPYYESSLTYVLH